MTSLQQVRRIASVGVLCALAPLHYATAQIPEKQWPALPVIVPRQAGDDIDLIPSPVVPPDPKPPGSDPLLSTATPPGVTGTLAYFARAQDGGQTPAYSVIALRSFGNTRRLPARHLGPATPNLHSAIATYGFHEGEYNSGNPQFSPDGQVMLYTQAGFMPAYGSGTLYEWDMKAGRVRRLTPGKLAYLNFFWTPDSQSVAYVTGGEKTNRPAQLCIVNRRTLRSQSVALPDGVSLLLESPAHRPSNTIPISWSSPTSVLLTGVVRAKAGDKAPARPNIYEATHGKARLVVSQAYAPSPSPDGRWIAYLGWPQSQADELKQQPQVTGPNIYLYDRRGRKRFFVRSLPKFQRREADNGFSSPFQVLQWTRDSRRLIVTETPAPEKSSPSEATAIISTLEIPSAGVAAPRWAQDLHRVTTLRMPDASTTPTIHFLPLQVSFDGKHLFVSTLQASGQGDQVVHESSLQSVNLSNGQVEELARFNADRIRGFDWREQQK